MASSIDFVVKNGLQVSTNIVVGTYTLNNTPISNGAIISGNVGIGTFNPTSQLHVYGNIKVSNTATSGGIIFPDGTFQNTSASGSTVYLNDDTTTNATRYLTFANATSGILTTLNTSSTKLTYNPLLATVNLTGGNLIVSNSTQVGNLSVTNTTAATSTTSGALTVAGGAGIAGNLYVGGRIFGVANTAFNASNVSVINTTTNAAFYPTFVEATSGNIGIRVDSGFTYNPSTDILSAGTFNATSLTNGGFQGIATDSATQPSFTWTGALTSGMWYDSTTVAVNTTVSGTNRFSVQTNQLRPTVPIGLGDDAYRGPILTFGAITGGTDYVDGTYTAVALTGGNGAIASANITVTNSSVSSVTLVAEGARYIAGDVLSVANTGVGGSGTGFSVPVATVRNAAINIYGLTTGTLPPRIRLMSSDTSVGAGQELGTVLFGSMDSNTGGRGDKVWLQGVAAGSSGGGQLRVYASLNAGEPTLSLTVNASSASFPVQIISTLANNTADGGGQIYLNGTGNRIDWNTNGVAPPAFTTRSAGTKLVLYPGVAAAAVDYALGIDSGTLWFSVSDTARSFKWYGGTTLGATLTGAGALTLTGALSTTNGTFSGNISTSSTTASTSSTTGALTVAGGAGINGNLYVGGNLVVQGNVTYLNTNVTVIEDPVITIGTGPNGANLTTADTYDRGLEFHYYSGAGDRYGFIGWQNSTGRLTYISNAAGGSSTQVYSGPFGDAQFGNIVVGGVSNTPVPSTTTGTGAITISGTGGIGLGGNINAGGNIYTAQGFNAAGLATVNYLISNTGISSTVLNITGGLSASTITSNNWINGTSITSSGTISAAGQITGQSLYSNSTITGDTISAFTLNATDINASGVVSLTGITSNTVTTSSTTGALIVAGGIATQSNLWVNASTWLNNLSIISSNVSTSTTTGALTVAGGVGIAGNVFAGSNMFVSSNVGIGTTVPVSGYVLTVNGGLAATTKSFVIPHPTRSGMKLQYASLEGPENGVYVRGKLDGDDVIELPDYWKHLIDPATITVHLTPYGSAQSLYVKDISSESITVASSSWLKSIKCFYTVYAERKDVPKLTVEI